MGVSKREEMLNVFIDYLRDIRHYSPHTLRGYRDDLLQFFAFHGLNEQEMDFSGITTKMVRSWLVAEMSGDCRRDRPGKKLSATSGRRKLSSVKAFFRFLVKRGLLEVDPSSAISGPKTAKRLPVFVPEEQMERVLDGGPGESGFSFSRDWLILLTLYATGLRRSELVALKIEDVDFSRQCLRVTGKGKKQREIPLIRELAEALACYLEARKAVVREEHHLFFVTDKGTPIYDKYVYRVIVRELAGDTSLSKRSPHVLRHTFATHLLNNGATIQGIQELLGHSSLAATQIYTHNTVEDMLKVFKQAHPRA